MPNKRLILTCIVLLSTIFGGAQDRPVRVPFRVSKENVSLPPYVDNSKTKYFPPLIDQKGGSCAQASGIGYMFTYEMDRLLDRDASVPANRFSYQFSWNFLNGGIDEGGFVDQGLLLARSYGMMSEDDYGSSYTYTFKWADGYDKYFRALHYKADEILSFTDSIGLLKRYLYDAGDGSAHGGVMTFSTQSENWKIQRYDGPQHTGYHSLLTKLATDGSHAMTIVGYDDAVTYTDEQGKTHDGAFIVVNSWGSYFASDGRFYLPYDFFRDPTVNIQQLSDNLNAVRCKTFTPLLVFKVRLRYTSRNDLSFAVRLNAGEIKGEYKTCALFRNQGGDIPMQGSGMSDEIEIAIDCTPHMQEGMDYDNVTLDVVKAAVGKTVGDGEILALSLMDYRGDTPVEHAYKGALPHPIKGGDNYLSIRIPKNYSVSASPYSYFKSGNANPNTFRIRTADGRDGKLRFSGYNAEDNSISIRYRIK